MLTWRSWDHGGVCRSKRRLRPGMVRSSEAKSETLWPSVFFGLGLITTAIHPSSPAEKSCTSLNCKILTQVPDDFSVAGSGWRGLVHKASTKKLNWTGLADHTARFAWEYYSMMPVVGHWSAINTGALRSTNEPSHLPHPIPTYKPTSPLPSDLLSTPSSARPSNRDIY
jgi:hypothetical protein